MAELAAGGAASSRWCEQCGTEYPAATPFCRTCLTDLVGHPPGHENDASAPSGIGSTASAAGGAAAGRAEGVAVRIGSASFAVTAGLALVLGRMEELAAASALAAYDNVSRLHCQITTDGTRTLVEDLDSTNGTYVDGVRLIPRQPQVLPPGAVLRLASDVNVHVEHRSSDG